MAKKRNWIMVTPTNIGLLRDAYDPNYIPKMRVGDQLPVYDRQHMAGCLRYWRRVRKFRGLGIREILAGATTGRGG